MIFHGRITQMGNGHQGTRCQSIISGRILHWMAVASAMSIKAPTEIVEKTIEVIAHWPDYATPLGIPQDTIEAINSTLITRL